MVAHIWAGHLGPVDPEEARPGAGRTGRGRTGSGCPRVRAPSSFPSQRAARVDARSSPASRVGRFGSLAGMASTPVKVTVTGAAGQIGYALLFRIAAGHLLGPTCRCACRCWRFRRR